MDSIAHRGATHLVIVTYADLTTDNATHTQTLFTLPASTTRYIGYRLVEAILKKAFDFSDAGIDGMTVAVGVSGTIEQQRAASGTVLAIDGTETHMIGPISGSPELTIVATSTALIATFVAVDSDGTPKAHHATSGEIHFYFEIRDSALEVAG
jgi:hypothetical protein